MFLGPYKSARSHYICLLYQIPDRMDFQIICSQPENIFGKPLGLFFYFFNGKICVDLIGLVEDGVSYHQFLREVIFCVAGAFVRVHMCLSKGIAR